MEKKSFPIKNDISTQNAWCQTKTPPALGLPLSSQEMTRFFHLKNMTQKFHSKNQRKSGGPPIGLDKKSTKRWYYIGIISWRNIMEERKFPDKEQ